jgi:hypothetical protein
MGDVSYNKPLQPWIDAESNNNDIYGVNLNKLSPELDRSMYDNRGKYFDTFKFNKQFDEYIKEQNALRLKNDELKLQDINKIENVQIEPYNLTFNQILINTQDMWIKIFSFNFSSFTVDDLFYLSISLISFGLIYLFFYFLFQ